MMHTVVKSHRSGRDVVPKKFVDEICGVLQDADIGLRKYAIKDFRTYIPVKLKELGWSDNIYLDRTSKICLWMPETMQNNTLSASVRPTSGLW